MKIRFASFEVDFEERELRESGVRIPLQHKPFRILELLLRQPGSLVTRRELAKDLWPDLHVNFERSLNSAVNTLRQVLGDSSRACRFIETRPGLGYRFIAEIQEPAPVHYRSPALASFTQSEYRVRLVTRSNMYHYQPSAALEELREESLLPNPVHIRDMIIRSRLSPEAALELNHKFQEYQQAFAEAQSLAKGVLERIAEQPRKTDS